MFLQIKRVIMRVLLLCFSFLISVLAAGDYLLSSEVLMQGNRSSLKGYTSFIFHSLLKTEGKEVIPIWMENQLQKVGELQKRDVSTPKGIDFDKRPSNFLIFSIDQLVDANGLILPVMRARLTTSSSVQIENNQTNSLLDTNEWLVYMKKEDLDKKLEQVFINLLQRFLKQYQTENKGKPIFCFTHREKP